MELEIRNSDRNKSAAHLPWVEKYRPAKLEQLISHQSILVTLDTFKEEGNLPNLLFYGPPGTGKTSTIVAMAREMYGSHFKSMVMELNASDERGISVVRDQIKKFADTKALSSNRDMKSNLKLIILDEADMMTNTAQFALRRIIEKYHSNARFCLISNYVSKIIPALQSRCTRFKFRQIEFQHARSRIEQICKVEGLNVTQDGISAVFDLCAGDMRRVVNMLQSLSMKENTVEIDAIAVYDFTGSPSPKFLQEIMNVLLNKSIESAFLNLSTALKQSGIALETILKNIYLSVLESRMPAEQQAFLVNRLGDIEYRLSIGCQENLALGSMIGAFSEMRHLSPQ